MAKKPETIKRSWVRESVPFQREERNDKFYNSWPWRKLRKRFLESNPLCKHCDAIGVITKAKVADHIVRINAGGEALDEDNLQPLCESCHNRKSAHESRDARGMG